MLVFVAPSYATDSRTTTTTSQNSAVFTDNQNIREGDPLAFRQVDIPIQGGMLSFNLCNQGITQGMSPPDSDSRDLPCRVTPPMIPPGVDTQLGTGLDPILGTGLPADGGDLGFSFGGNTNDGLQDGTSNIQIPGFLIHGGAISVTPGGIGTAGPITLTGEVTNNCVDSAVCGTQMDKNVITHFQKIESRPISSPGTLCSPPQPTTNRCSQVTFGFDQDMTGSEQAQTALTMAFEVNSETDSTGKLVKAGGKYTINCPTTTDQATFGCPNGTITGTFTVTEPVGGFTTTSTDFVTITQDAPNNTFCLPTDTFDPFNRDGTTCQAR
ncbi:MAG: hypothetical protein ACE5FZ_07160 [Nitrospiria bacterium]